MKNIHKTILFTVILCLVVISTALYIQLTGQSKLSGGCSYLDPISVDLFAFLVAVFLVIEGIIRIAEHPQASLKRQLTRPIRIAIGCAIITLHVLQFLHK